MSSGQGTNQPGQWQQTGSNNNQPGLNPTNPPSMPQPGQGNSPNTEQNQQTAPKPTPSGPMPEERPMATTEAPGQLIDNNCASSGFVGDQQNCKKFYRCVENGRGGFIKYEFTCGDGTVWDQETQACNYPYTVRGRCYSAQPVDSGSNGTTSNQNGINQGSSSGSKSIFNSSWYLNTSLSVLASTQTGSQQGSNQNQNEINNQGSTSGGL